MTDLETGETICIGSFSTSTGIPSTLSFRLTAVQGFGGGEDPHFTVLSKDEKVVGLTYTPKAKEEGFYNIFTNKQFQWNSFWKFYEDIPYTLSANQFITEMSFVIKHPEFYFVKEENKQKSRNKLSFGKFVLKRVAVPEDQRRSAELIVKVKCDQEKQKYVVLDVLSNSLYDSYSVSQNVSAVPYKKMKKFYLFGEEFPLYYFQKPTDWSILISTPYAKIKLRATYLDLLNKKSLNAKQRRQAEKFPKYSWPFMDFTVGVEESKEMKQSHGLLGQTMRPNCPYKMPVGKEDCVECFVEGKVEDYKIADANPFGTKFKFNQF